MQLSNKIALVTGGTGTLGSAVATRLASEGVQVTATYLREQSLGQIPQALREKVTFTKADVTNERDVIALYDGILSASSHLDIVVNTVGGYLPQKPLTETTVAEWDSMMNLNLKSAFLSTREALRRMQGQAYGRIINVSAMVGLCPTPGRAPYAISKAGVSLLTDLSAQEVKGSGITVNAIAPSIIGTGPIPGEGSSKWVTPQEIADLVWYLCSSAAGSITGTTVKAYGGV